MRYPKPQLNISALESVPPLLELASSLEWLKNHSDLILHLYEKICDSNQKSRYLALQLFVLLCQAMTTSAFTYITKAATNFARRQNKSPFVELIYSLNKKWDVEVRHLAIQLINCLIVKCSSEKKVSKFIARLENIGLYDELMSLSQEKKHAGIIKQLQNFQINTKQVLPSM